MTPAELLADLERARGIAVALEQECAVLTDVLALFTHEYRAQVTRPGHCHCGLRADNVEHRTPAFLRKRYGFGI